MYAVVKYFNYRKDVSFEILCIEADYWRAEKIARQYAERDYDDVVENVLEPFVYVPDTLVQFTSGSGYDKFVYAVVEVLEQAAH